MEDKKSAMGGKLLTVLGLQLSVLVYSSTCIFTKLASREPGLTLGFVVLYGIAIGIMFIYAVVWQQFLRRMPLSTAYANRSMSTVWTMLFGAFFFREEITLTMWIGAVVIIFGVYLVVTDYE